jgi:arabinofuranosyltransferase
MVQPGVTSPGEGRHRSRIRRLLLCCAIILALVGELHFANITFDDAFISFRYAENLASGHGLVFNLGERVEGYSNFLWTVLLTIPIWLRIDRFELGLLATAKLLGMLFSIGTLLVVTRAAALDRQPAERTSAPLAALYLATLVPFLMWGIGALETPLVTLLIAATIYLHLREDLAVRAGLPAIPWSYLVLCLAALTRPEPVILFLPLAALRLGRTLHVTGRRALARELAYLGLFAGPYATFIACRYGYYGQIVPNTYFAKVSGDELTAVRGGLYLERTFAHLNWATLGAVGCGFILLARRFSYRFCAVLLLCAVYVVAVFYEGGDWMPACRMFVPMLPLVALLIHEAWVAVGALSLTHLAPRGGAPPWVIRPEWLAAWQQGIVTLRDNAKALAAMRAFRFVSYGALVLALVSGSVGSFDTVPVVGALSGLRGLRLDHSRYFGVARWMVREIHEPGLLAIGEAGVVPYYTRLPVLDFHGLMDLHIARLPGAMHRKFDAAYVFARRPKYVLLLVNRAADGKLSSDFLYSRALLEDSRFTREYSPLRDFEVAILYARKPD